MRGLLAMLGVAAGLVSPARAADEPEVPEVDFLEYLGSFQAEDEEWVVEAGWEEDVYEDEQIVPPADGRPQPDTELEGTE